MTRTFWLSFGASVGVAVIDVTEADVAATPKPPRATAPAWANPEVRWMAAAMRLSWERACNPGGEIGIAEVPSTHPAPRNRLLVGPELAQWGAKEQRH